VNNPKAMLNRRERRERRESFFIDYPARQGNQSGRGLRALPQMTDENESLCSLRPLRLYTAGVKKGMGVAIGQRMIEQPSKPDFPRPPDPIDKPPPDIKPVPPPDIPVPSAPDVQPPTFPERGNGPAAI
jgi:hypothetical protein